MSAFENSQKDYVYEAICELGKHLTEETPNIKVSELMKEINDVISYSVERVLWDFEKNKESN